METPRTPSRSSSLDLWLDVAPWPIHLLDSRGLPIRPNPTLAALLGYSIQELDRMTLRRSIPSRTRQRLAECGRAISKSNPPPYVEAALSYHHRDGSEIRVRRARISPIKTDAGPALVMLAGLARPQATTRAEIQARFSRLIAHDFNNVFTIAQSYVDLARRQSTTTRLAMDYLERAARAIRRGIDLNEHLQTIALHDKLPVDLSSFNDVIDVIRLYLPRLLSPGPKWSIYAQQSLPPLLSHPILLTRFFIDLCVNAQLRWPHSTELSLDVRRAPGNYSAIMIHISPPAETAPPLPLPFQLYLCRHDLFSTVQLDPLFVHGIIERHPISIDCSDEAVVALLTAYEE